MNPDDLKADGDGHVRVRWGCRFIQEHRAGAPPPCSQLDEEGGEEEKRQRGALLRVPSQ